MADQTDVHIRQLNPRAAEAAWWLVWAARTAGYPVVLSASRRSIEEQRRLFGLGRTRTLNSAHLAGNAFDIDWYRTARDDVPREFWKLIGPWAERELQLGWGGRFRPLADDGIGWDPGHFEIIVPIRA